MRMIDEKKILPNVLGCFKLCCYMLTCKIIKSNACTGFANVNIALNLHSYEEN